jgi:hypothetical protein
MALCVPEDEMTWEYDPATLSRVSRPTVSGLRTAPPVVAEWAVRQ